ncbi:MAG: dTDP-glucose 4,6-dehydratase [Thermodesulfobacteriota bacterium]
MRILVTGGAGFIGSHFIRYILRKYPDYEVINLDKLTYAGNLENLSDIEGDKRYRFVRGDIGDAALVDGVAGEVECIVNFAAETHVDRSIDDPAAFIRTDVQGTHVLLEAARKYNHRRYLQISTDEVYGSVEEGSFREDNPLRPNSPYAASKAGADLLVLSYVTTYGFPALITRSSNNFGPNQYPEKFIPLFTINALRDRELPLYGDGLNVRDWIYVEDNCAGIDAVLHRGEAGEVYNIGGGNEKTNIEIVGMILEATKKPRELIRFVKDRPGHDRRYSLDCEKAKGLGFTPRHDFEEAVKQTVEWYMENRGWWERILSGEFTSYYERLYGERLKGE